MAATKPRPCDCLGLVLILLALFFLSGCAAVPAKPLLWATMTL